LNNLSCFPAKTEISGDIVGIIDKGGASVVEYTYDAWGKPTGVTGSMAETLGVVNPFRYRGYVWDEETGLYYLRSRYYDPQWGRFLNADTLLGKPGALLSHNLFAYCVNNPVNRSDPSGRASYDAAAAIAYAIRYATNRNCPPYKNLTTALGPKVSNCANFVSQCLFAGGIPLSRGKKDDNRRWYYAHPLVSMLIGKGKNDYGFDSDPIDSLNKNGKGSISDQYQALLGDGKVKLGDVIGVQYNDGDNYYDHVMIVTGVTDTEIFFASNSNETSKDVWYKSISDFLGENEVKRIRFIHIE
jgi:RHS repeat-associated protein